MLNCFWAVVNTYCLLRRQGMTKWGSTKEIYRALDELFTLYVAMEVHKANQRKRQDNE